MAVPGFNLSALPSPDVAVSVQCEAGVAPAVRAAAARSMPVAVRATGHGPVHGVDCGVLIGTRTMSTVSVDPVRRTATTGAEGGEIGVFFDQHLR